MALVRCGTEILTEQGFHATGIEEVLKRVGVPKGSFYHYFESKQAFGQAVIDNYAEYFAKKLDRLFGDTSRPPIERLKAFVEEATRAMERYQFQRGCLIGNMGQELAGLNDDFRARLESVLQSWQARVAGVLAQAQDRGQLSADADVNAIAEFFWIGWEGAILRAKLTRSVAPLDRFANLFFDRILPS
ncbi:MAG: TetR/AcrR family transcriptional regulator [Pigmentiphaga sp.]|uniref:acrylate utilization transcriptional regulator AcuR n=1 Tax=Pigmentiphaga sp. TaxID=1977564 RepID=UPI0029BC0321|nr:TetR/AcrR family transcriptional regulator [Pigmentiphaga sp.]MDX3907449.1 TetR/AcrR family transcriptional regulator [Pigmentiphaga sp.]